MLVTPALLYKAEFWAMKNCWPRCAPLLYCQTSCSICIFTSFFVLISTAAFMHYFEDFHQWRFRWFTLWPLKKLFIFDFLKGLLYHVIVAAAAAVTSTITATDWVEKQDLTCALCYSSSSFRKTSMQWWIGLTKLILCAAYQCMGSQSAIFQVRKLMQQDLCASCLMIWNQEFQCSSAELGFVLVHFTSFCFIQVYGSYVNDFVLQFVDEACHQIERNERNVKQIGVQSYIPR